MAKATVFVLSSDYEGLPHVLLEAMACGLPVISTRCQYGPEEVITPGINGLLVPANDVEALAGAIRRVLSDGHLRRQLSAAGKNRAEDFNNDKIVEQYEQLFLESLNSTHQS